MIDFSAATLSSLAIHYIGSKSGDEGCRLSEEVVHLNETISSLLVSFFTKSFRMQEIYQFAHETSLEFNEIYSAARAVLLKRDDLLHQSATIARHLYSVSDHPNIKSGELYVAFLQKCQYEGNYVDAIGIFKSEQKDTYLKVFPEGKSYHVNEDLGININKLDKGCVVFNTGEQDGYRALVVDNLNRDEARYWKDQFLKVKPHDNAYSNTRNYMQLCRQFAIEAFPEAEKLDQVGLIRESARFFEEEDTFDKQKFEDHVLQEPELVEAFHQYKHEFEQRNAVDIQDEFEIDAMAVKNLKRVFKSVIKLDKNFHIYVHGDRNLIRKGYDEESHLHFYQLYFKSES